MFQLDGAPPHTSNLVRPLLDSSFPDSKITYLSPPDFFVCRFVKDEVFTTPARNLTKLKLRITGAIASIQQETFQKVWKNFENRLHAIIREDGGDIEHL